MEIEKVVREYIDKTIHMSLATASGDTPWICEVHFAYDGKLNLYFRSLKSRRHSQEIAANPKVAGNIIDKYNLGDTEVGLSYEGTAALIEDKNERQVAFDCLQARLGISEIALTEAEIEEGHQFYKIQISNWYVMGKFGTPKNEKYTLDWNN
jgi:uncharacterized protein YhbP (UPF0306 family)